MVINSNEYKEYVSNKIAEYNKNNKETILFFTDAYYPVIDGVVNVIHNLSIRAMKDFNVIVCTPACKGEIKIQDYLVLACKDIYFGFLNYSLAKPNDDKFFKQKLNSIEKVKIIHCHSPFSMGAFANKFAKKHAIPLVYTFHSLYKNDVKQQSKLNSLTWIIMKIIISRFNHALKIFTMTEASKKVAISYGVKKEFLLVPNGNSFKKISDDKNYEQIIKNKYQLSNKKIILGVVCRLVKVKNVFFILEVLKELKTKGFDFQFIFVGDGPERKSLEKKVIKYQIQDYVVFTGQISDSNELINMYKLIDLLVLPSTYDNQSLTISEAASQNVPSLLIKDSVTSYFVKDQINGYTEVEDAGKFADKIIKIFTDKKTLQTVKKNCQKDLIFHWDDCYKILKDHYAQIIKETQKN